MKSYDGGNVMFPRWQPLSTDIYMYLCASALPEGMEFIAHLYQSVRETRTRVLETVELSLIPVVHSVDYTYITVSFHWINQC